MQLWLSLSIILFGLRPLASARPAFAGDFVLESLQVQSPFQTDPKSTSNSTISFTFSDQDRPATAAVRCSIQWAVGLLPPASFSRTGHCEDPSVDVWFPDETYHGITNFTVALSHSYVDDNVGQYPYNRLTKFAELNLTFPGTVNYECDAGGNKCKSCDGTSIIALVTTSIA